jgi:uncharacterized membrane protein YhaH (DUF805 family)
LFIGFVIVLFIVILLFFIVFIVPHARRLMEWGRSEMLRPLGILQARRLRELGRSETLICLFFENPST